MLAIQSLSELLNSDMPPQAIQKHTAMVSYMPGGTANSWTKTYQLATTYNLCLYVLIFHNKKIAINALFRNKPGENWCIKLKKKKLY